MPVQLDDFLGVKLASAVAGFAGGIASLSFLTGLTKFQGLCAVITGCLCAGYLTPVFLMASQRYVSPDVPELSIAFLVGLTSMNLIPALIKASDFIPAYVRQFVLKRPPGEDK